ncbi:hypothetical protein BDZ97DRAFT_1752331 [Flammula alnicola]|nr:hypothetical protein BDZ97DRAFT_1752331 [Flammula alnicola]
MHFFEVPTTRQHIKGVVFCKKGMSIVGGRDHGKIYLFNLKASEIHFDQVMTHGSISFLIQAVACASLDKHHLIISGSSDNKSDICVWEKPRTLNKIEYMEKLDDALLERLDNRMWCKFLKMGPELIEKDHKFPDNKDESQTGVDRQLAIKGQA